MKLTLLDFPGKVACTVFTPGCNFQCPYCHNASLVNGDAQLISEEEFFDFIRKRFGILDGVCVTGGEPSVQNDLAEFIGKIKNIGYSVKLDTNGSNPAKLRELIENKLIDYVAMDIKNSPSKYESSCGLPAGSGGAVLDRIRESIAILRGSGLNFEFRTTVVKQLHTDSDFHEIGLLIRGAPKYFLQCFKDSGDLLQNGLSAFDENALEALRQAILPYLPNARLRGI